MVILFEELAMLIILWFLRLNDGIMELFNAFTGISNVQSTSTGESGTLINMVFSSSSINTIFWSIVVLAVMLLALFSIVAIIRNMIKNDKRISDIVGKIVIAVIGMFAVMALILIVMAIVDELVVLLADILQMDSGLKFSQILFDSFVGDAWANGYSVADFDCTMTVSEIMGSYKTVIGFWPSAWKNNKLIYCDDFFYLPALIGTVVTCWYLFVATVNLGKRVFELVYVYFCMPAAMAVLPLDDGARVKNWTESFTARLVVIFGSVLSVNVFTIVMPVVITLEVPGLGSFGNCIFRIIIVCCGASLIPAGGRLFERIFVSREEAFFDGRNGGVMATMRFIERHAVASAGGLISGAANLGATSIDRARELHRGNKASKKSSAASAERDRQEGAFRENVLGSLGQISGNTHSTATNSALTSASSDRIARNSDITAGTSYRAANAAEKLSGHGGAGGSQDSDGNGGGSE